MNNRLAPGLVWPVRASELNAALGESREAVEIAWLSWVKQPTVTAIGVTWAPLTNGMPDHPESHHGVKVWIYPVAKANHQALRGVVTAQVLPDLAAWCREALAAPEGWKLMRHDRRWSLRGDTVSVKEREGVAALRWE